MTLTIFINFAPNKYVTFDDKYLVWMNENIKSKNKLSQVYIKKCRFDTYFGVLEESACNLNDLILQTKTSNYKIQGKKFNFKKELIGP